MSNSKYYCYDCGNAKETTMFSLGEVDPYDPYGRSKVIYVCWDCYHVREEDEMRMDEFDIKDQP